MRSCLPLLFAALALAGCNRRSDAGPVVVSAIGAAPRLVDPARGAADAPGRYLLDSLAQGLVRFDANGQVTPGLAERWTVLDDGMSYVFRLREAEWSDGGPVTAADVVVALKHQLAPASRNPLLPYLSAIDEIVEMTPTVIEVRLKRPRPDLLKLFAQPELAIVRPRPVRGTGPYRLASSTPDSARLRPAFDPARALDDEPVEPGPDQTVELIGERASLAIVRFLARKSDMVTGGSFADWPLVALSGAEPANLRIEVPAGLFGLAIVDRRGFLADAENRAAVAAAIDRPALTAAYAPGWSATETLLPETLDSARPPSAPAWSALSPADRRALAAARVAAWRADHRDDPMLLRIALPGGSGATILYGFVASALRAAGFATERVGLDDDAELRLVDAVAPYDSARWYLAQACAACGDEAQAAIDAARDAPTLAERARAISEADAALTNDSAFIPIARPLRWSLVALRLTRWQRNARGWHPFNDLRNPNP